LRSSDLSGRLSSLDAFHGMAIAAMLLVNNPGTWSHHYAPLGHAEWHGWTPTDLIFPIFLFIVGVSMTFSFGKRMGTESKKELHRDVLRQAAIIYALGLLLSLFPRFDFANLRYVGVLPRISLVYLVASILMLHLSRRALAWVTAGLWLGYQRWAKPLVVFGVNAIAAFVLSGLVSRALLFTDISRGGETLALKRWIFDGFFSPRALPINASPAYAVTQLLLIWVLMTFLYRRRIFLKV